MLYRLKTDFRLSIITLLGASALLGITPFAVFRFLSGNMVMGIVDVVILLSISAAMVVAWRTGETRRTGLFMAVCACTGGVVVGTLLGDIGIFWMYPPLLTSFFLTTPRVAMTINSLALAAVAVQPEIFDSLEQQLSFLTTGIIAAACAFIFALRHESQRAKLESLATHDPLTGAKNRRAMEEALVGAVKTAERTEATYTLLLLDLDHFKEVNDRHGHGVGDAVLIQCADLLRSRIRESDSLFRFGGEEFVLLLPGVKRAGVETVCRMLRLALKQRLRCPSGPVTASFGAAMLREGETWEEWLGRADSALYQAKEAGRDCIVIAEPDYPAPLR